MRLACLLLLLPLAFAALEARKEVAGGPHQFIVSVSYRWTGSGKGSDVTVEDELPNTLALLGGSLVRKLPAATAQWQSVQYTVGASEELVFTLQNRSYNITLPAARFSYQPAETKQRETVETAPVTLTIWHPSVEGTWSASWLVMLVAWVLPVVAAYVSIGALSAAPAPAAAAAAKPKKN